MAGPEVPVPGAMAGAIQNNPQVGAHVQFSPYTLANYAPMMSAIEQAGQTILNSPLNPEVRSRMQLAAAGAQAGQREIAWAEKTGYLPLMGSVHGGQFGLSAGGLPQSVTQGLLPQGVGKEDPNAPPNPNTTPEGAQNNGNAPAPETPQQAPQPQVTPPAHGQGSGPGGTDFGVTQSPADATKGQNYGQTTQPSQYFASGNGQNAPGAPGVNPNLSASTDNDFLLRRNAQQQAGQQQAEQVGQQALVDWQNNNQGGVMSAVQAKEWAQHNLDTDINRAVYLPQGGPPGANGQKEPAFAFFGKKGGTNVVPISQMVKAGAGPLVAAQNSSQVLNTADQANKAASRVNQQQQSGSPTPMSAQMGQPQPQGPPAAPTGQTDYGAMPGQLPNDEFQRRVNQATSVNAPGGTASNEPAGMPQKVSLSNGSTTDENGTGTAGNNNHQFDPSNPTPDGVKYTYNTTGVTPQIRDQLLHNVNQNPNAQTNSFGDPFAGHYGNYDWYRTRTGNSLYAVRPGNNLFSESRLYWGDNQWQPTALPQQELRRNLHEIDNTIPMEKLNAMSTDELQAHLQEYRQLQLLQFQPQLDAGVQDNLDHLSGEVKAATHVQNATKGMNPQDYNISALANNARVREGEQFKTGINSPQNLVNAFQGGLSTFMGGGKLNSDSKLNYIDKNWNDLKAFMGGNRAGGENEAQEFENLQRLYGTKDFPSALDHFLNQRKTDYVKAVTVSTANNQRLPKGYADMSNAILRHQPWSDPGDDYGPGKNTPVGPVEQAESNMPNGKAPGAPGASPSPQGTPMTGTEGNPAIVTNKAERDKIKAQGGNNNWYKIPGDNTLYRAQ